MEKEVHKMNLINSAYYCILNDLKDIELRLYDEKRQWLKIGDYIEFTNIDTDEKMIVEIKNLYVRKSFKELFDEFDIKRFGFIDNEDASIMNNFYTEEEQKKYKAVGIEIVRV